MNKSFLYDYHSEEISYIRQMGRDKDVTDMFIQFVISGIPISYIVKIFDTGLPEEREYLDYDFFTDKVEGKSGFRSIKPRSDFVSVRLKSYLQEFLSEVMPTGMSLMLGGANDTGKTYMMTFILCYLIERYDLNCYYINSREMYKVYNAGMYHSDESARKLYNYVKRCDVLAIDELGKDTDTDTFRQVLEGLIRDRVYRGLPMVVATNIDIGKDGEKNLTSKLGYSVFSVLSEKFKAVLFTKSNKFRQRASVKWPGGK